MAEPTRGPAPLFAWRMAIADSDLRSTTRHVLLQLSCHMDLDGQGAWPGSARLAHDTGLHIGTVKQMLAVALDAGWLELVERGGTTGMARRANVWRATIPPTSCGQPAVRSVGNGPPDRSSSLTRPVVVADPNSSVSSTGNSSGGASSMVVEMSPENGCIQCNSTGLVYNATGGFDARCPCTYAPAGARPVHATRPPDVDELGVRFGMPANR